MKQHVVQLLKKEVDLPEAQISALLETPPSRVHGDVAFPCFQLAKQLRKAPPLIASELVEKLQQQPLADYGIKHIKHTGPYLNLFFDRQAIARQLLEADVAKLVKQAGPGERKRIVVEYSSPNIAKDFKLYHIRTTMIGQALANTYDALGYQVERMNHLGDWGTQFGKMIAAYRMWGDESRVKANPISELVALYVRFHEEAEKNPALEDEGRLWFKKLEEGEGEAVSLWQWFKDESLKEFNQIYDLLNISFDHWYGESYYSDKMEDVLGQLKTKGLLEESEGALVVRLDEQNIPPCIIQKSDGASIYATRDLAAAIYRGERFNPVKILYVVDQRQALHFQQVFSVLKKMDLPYADACEHLPFGIMKIEGEIGSTRKGKGLLLMDVLDYAIEKAAAIIDEKNPGLQNKSEVAKAIGIGAIVFNDLKHHRTHEVDFKWDEAFNFEGKTGPYVQYTHARICSLLRKAGQTEVKPADHEIYESELGWELLYTLQQYPEVLIETTKKNDPSQIAKYLLDLCQLFNRFYAQERFIVENVLEQQAKLALAQGVARTLRHGLSMLNIAAPEAI